MCSYTPSALQKVKRSVAGMIRFTVSRAGRPVRWLNGWLSRRRCLRPLRAWLVNLGRRLVVSVLAHLVKLGRQAIRQRSRGNRNCSRPSSMSC
jgi:hypothetical protein